MSTTNVNTKVLLSMKIERPENLEEVFFTCENYVADPLDPTKSGVCLLRDTLPDFMENVEGRTYGPPTSRGKCQLEKKVRGTCNKTLSYKIRKEE